MLLRDKTTIKHITWIPQKNTLEYGSRCKYVCIRSASTAPI